VELLAEQWLESGFFCYETEFFCKRSTFLFYFFYRMWGKMRIRMAFLGQEAPLRPRLCVVPIGVFGVPHRKIIMVLCNRPGKLRAQIFRKAPPISPHQTSEH